MGYEEGATMKFVIEYYIDESEHDQRVVEASFSQSPLPHRAIPDVPSDATARGMATFKT